MRPGCLKEFTRNERHRKILRNTFLLKLRASSEIQMTYKDKINQFDHFYNLDVLMHVSMHDKENIWFHFSKKQQKLANDDK